MTERARYTFTVKERADGAPYIVMESFHENLTALSSGFLSFDLPEGTTHARAKEIAEYLNANIAGVAYTLLRDDLH